MHIATDLKSLPLSPEALARGCAVTIGNFDGVHKGHQQLIARVIEKARRNNLPAVVITFDPHPLRVMMGDNAPPMLISLQHKLECFANLGVDLALVLPFSKNAATQSPEDFIAEVLVNALHTRELVVGYDYAFGKGRTGNAELLAKLGTEHGFAVEQRAPFLVDNAIVSSTRIREELLRGNVDAATLLSGRPYCVEGTIEHGMNRGGKLLGFPTANMRGNERLLLPASGVYAVLAELNPPRSSITGVCEGSGTNFLQGVASVGNNPTFGDSFVRVETYLLNFNADIYDNHLRVYFIQRLRDERKFEGVDALVTQIRQDVTQAEAVLAAKANIVYSLKKGIKSDSYL